MLHTPKRLFVAALLTMAVGATYLVQTSSNRLARISNWLDPTCQSDPDSWCGQSVHGMYALADGGWWGVGLGGFRLGGVRVLAHGGLLVWGFHSP